MEFILLRRLNSALVMVPRFSVDIMMIGNCYRQKLGSSDSCIIDRKVEGQGWRIEPGFAKTVVHNRIKEWGKVSNGNERWCTQLDKNVEW